MSMLMKKKYIKDFLGQYDSNSEKEFTWRKKLCLLIFALAFPVLIWGVSLGGWWFQEMTALFFRSSYCYYVSFWTIRKRGY